MKTTTTLLRSTALLVLTTISLLLTSMGANAQNWNEIVKTVASDRATTDQYGGSVAISGDYAIVGAWAEDEDVSGGNTFTNAGSAYILKNNAGTWSQVQKIVASDRAATDFFGFSVSISGDYAIIGAYQEDQDATGGSNMTNSGSAYVFKNNAGTWSQVQKIVASDRGGTDFFGYSVAISGDYAIVGAYAEDHDVTGGAALSNSGSAYIFRNNAGTWSQVQKIVSSDRGFDDRFGWSVAISGDYAIVGAIREDHDETGGGIVRNSAGSAYIFQNNAGTWSQMQKIVASDRAANDNFSHSVAISGNYAIVGAIFEDHNATGGVTVGDAGSAYIFQNNAGTWSQAQKIVASDRGTSDNFGVSVAISGNHAIIGAYREDHNATGGSSVTDAGSAYIFKQTAGVWAQQQKIVAAVRANYDQFGNSVAIGNNYAVVGAHWEDEDASGGATAEKAGSAYFFEAPITTITWNGSTSTDWNTAANWTPGGVPAATGNVVIPNVANDPVISGSFTINDVDLQSGATLTVANGGSFQLDGALTNAGSVTIQSGGSFLQGGSSSITGAGTFNVQRQGGSLYNMWSSPITAQNGVPGTSYEYVSSASTQDDSDDAEDPGWSAFNGTMTPGKGYAGLGGGLNTFTGTPNNGNVNYSLYYTAFDNTYTQTSGGTPFNLVGNPYPSAISAASFLAANSDLFGTIYLWNDNGSNNYSRTDYAYWNGTGGLGTGGGPTPNGFIGSCQGFMVRALSGGAVANFTNTQRVTGNNGQFHRENGADSRLWFSVENENVYNEILIGLLEDATEDEDVMYDAVKLKGNPDISLSAINQETEYAIMAFPPPLTEKTVPLQLEISQAGTYTFTANTMENFEGQELRFMDLQTGMNVPVHEGQGIEVALQAGEYTDRFYLNFSPMSATGIEEEATDELNAWANGEQLFIQLTSEVQDATLQVIDMNGKRIFESPLSGSAAGTIGVPFNASKGVYLVRVSNTNINLTQKIFR